MTRVARETSRQRWVRETRESVHRAMAREFVASAAGLEGNLDVSSYSPGLGFRGVRSVREIAAALRWLEERGWATRTGERDRLYGGELWELTRAGGEKVPERGRLFPETYGRCPEVTGAE